MDDLWSVCTCVIPVLVVGFTLWNRFAPGPFNRLVKKGQPAKGILLAVPSAGARAAGSTPTNPIEVAQVTIDIEIPGQAPYEVNCAAFYPRNMRGDVLPGATVELRVDPTKRDQVAIVGPGSGFAVTGLVQAPAVNGTSS